ncbi:transcriptional regulator [Glaciimonas sp. GG7]
MRYEFIETSLFSANVYDYLTDEEYKNLQEYLSDNHDAGDIVRGSGGVRKVRWARAGAGKSGGVRVCYYVRTQGGQILMLVIYAKSNRAAIPGHILKQLKEIFDEAD